MKTGENIHFNLHRYLFFIMSVLFIFMLFSENGFATAGDSAGNVNNGKYSFSVADSLSKKYQENDPAETYRMLIRKAEWAYEYRQYERAVNFYQQAIDQRPWESAPVERIEEIMAGTERGKLFFIPYVDFEKSSALIKVLLLVIIYSIISMISLLVIILFHRNQMEGEARFRQVLKEKYQLLLMDYLFSDDGNDAKPGKINKIVADNFKRQILMEEMKDLIVNLSGEHADSLRDLYNKLNLNKDSVRKSSSKKWHIKIKGFRELAFMNIKVANDEIIRCLQSNNSILRMEAQLALVRLNDNDRFAFLDHIQRPFTKWEQMNVHEMITSHNLEVPDFMKWLNSDNRTVVIFALNMIKVFNQRHAWKQIVELLKHEETEIRRTAIFILGELEIKGAVPALKHHYKYEVYENQLAIVIALNRISDESALNFLIMVIDKEDDVQLQIEAAKALRDMGDAGQRALEKLMHSDYKNYMIIIKHVLDKRI
jgi:hypothetical protein